MQAAGKRHIRYGSRSDEFRIWHLSDLHWMSKSCDEKGIKRDIAEIAADPHSFWLGGGDYAEFIGYSDKRFDPDAVAPWVSVKDLGDLGRVGMRQVRDLFEPIKHKCFGLVIGNHEKKYEQYNEQDSLHLWLCEELGVPPLEYSALFDIAFHRCPRCRKPEMVPDLPEKMNGTSTFRVYVHHGAGAACTPGGKLNRLVQFMQSFKADIYFCGHVHDKVSRREPMIGADKDCKKLEQYDRLGAIAGSYLKTYQQGTCSYGEQKGYRPVSLGAAIVHIVPTTRKVWAEV